MRKLMMLMAVVLLLTTIAQGTIVGNAGFELPEVDSGGIFTGVGSPWSPRGGSYGSQEIFDPAIQVSAYTNGVTQGNQAVSVTGTNSAQLHWVWQYFLLTPGSYTLTADVAANKTKDFSGYRVELVKSSTGTVIARDLNTLADQILETKGDWVTSSLNFVVSEETYYSLRLVAAAPLAGMTESAVCFDNVTLVPEPATLMLLGIGSLIMLKKRN